MALSEGCQLATIKTSEEQAAAMGAMEPYIGYEYASTQGSEGSYAFIDGLEVIQYRDDPYEGRYVFSWQDGEYLEVLKGDNSNATIYDLVVVTGGNQTRPGYANFIPSEPNALKETASGLFDSIALSLNENGSQGIPRGGWILLDAGQFQNPAIYQCCATDFPTCIL